MAGDRAALVPGEGDLVGGKYRIGAVLGEGGMGVVLAGRHEALGQDVAIKLLLPQAIEVEGAVARFLREARTAASLRSEHVARVIDVGTLDSGLPYMVMERLVGRDLSDVLAARKHLPPNEAIDLILQTCEAMAEAHALGIVHRDLKPSNLFLTHRPNGTPFVKILDFGISKVEDKTQTAAERGRLTTTGAVMGSPIYMSPEQIRSSKNVDARTDIWSLGVILHELVAGKHPFEAETLTAIMAAIAADPPFRLREHRADAPAELEAVVLRCLEKDVSKRYPDIGSLVAALRPDDARRSGSSLSLPLAALMPPAPRSDDNTLVQDAVSEARSATSQAPGASAPIGPSALAETLGAWGGSSTGRRRRRQRTVAGVVGVTAAALGVFAVERWVFGPGAPAGAASSTPGSSAPVQATSATTLPANAMTTTAAVPDVTPAPPLATSPTASPTDAPQTSAARARPGPGAAPPTKRTAGPTRAPADTAPIAPANAKAQAPPAPSDPSPPSKGVKRDPLIDR